MSIFQRMCSTMFLFLNTCLIFKKIVASPFLLVCSSSANENGFYLIHSKTPAPVFIRTYASIASPETKEDIVLK